MTIMGEASENGTLDGAVMRLDRALAKLDAQVTSLTREAQNHNGGLFDEDRSNLAAELDAARGRERALRDAGAGASAALGRAIVDLRAVLSDPDEEAAAFVDQEA